MRIISIEPIVLTQNLSPSECFSYSQNRYKSRSVLICRVETDNGIVGWGESFGPAHIHKTTIEQYYAPALIGRDPFDDTVIWENLYDSLRDHGQRGLAIEAISAIDIALWDIKGKFLTMPVYKLLGGAFRTCVTPYATGLYQRDDKSISGLEEEAMRYQEEGFVGIKLKVGFGLNYDTRAIKAVREAVGSNMKLMIDANHAYNARNAIALGREIEEYDIAWFEEPVPPEDLEGYKEVKRFLDIPLAGGETESTRYDFRRWLQSRVVDIVQPDLGVVGGISEFKKIAVLAHTHNIQCYPHVWGSAINFHAALHCAVNLPHFPASLNPDILFFEYDRTTNVFRDTLSKTMPLFKDGTIECPDLPGLGLTIDERIIEKYRI